MFIVLPPTPSSDFFVISFTDAACQQTSEGHAQNVAQSHKRDGHAYFGHIVYDEIDHQSVTALKVRKYVRILLVLRKAYDFQREIVMGLTVGWTAAVSL